MAMAISQTFALHATDFANIEFFKGGSLAVSKAGNVQLHLAKSEQVTVKVYTTLGKEVMDLSGNYSGTNSLILSGRLSAGRYIVTALGEGFKTIRAVNVK
jgi:hypothetical protein